MIPLLWLKALPWGKIVPALLGAVVVALLYGLGFKHGRNAGDAEVAQLKQEQADTRAAYAEKLVQLAEGQINIQAAIRSFFDDSNNRIDASRRAVDRLAGGVQVCDALTSYLVSRPAEGADGDTSAVGPPRPAVEVLQELAADSSTDADKYAVIIEGWRKWAADTQKAARSPQ